MFILAPVYPIATSAEEMRAVIFMPVDPSANTSLATSAPIAIAATDSHISEVFQPGFGVFAVMLFFT